MKCNPNCFYFPNDNSIKHICSYLDDFGLKHQEREFICFYDGHKIEKWEYCENYKTFYEVMNIDS